MPGRCANLLPPRGGGPGAAWSAVRFVLAAIPAAAVAAILFDVGSNLGRGYDVTDEGSYLNALANPDDVLVSATRYHYYTRTLFLLAGGSVYGLRLLAAAVLLLAAAGFAAVLQRAVERGRSGPASIAERTATAGTICAAALAFYGPWIPTPGYNWMNLLACLVFASAILVTHRPHRAGPPARPVRGGRWLAGAALAGAGGAAALLAKPTTAALLGLLWAAWVSYAGRAGERIRPLICSALAGSLFVALHVLAFEESPSAFVAGLRTSASLIGELSPDYRMRDLVVRSAADLAAIPRMLFRELGFSLALSFLTMLILRLALPRDRAAAVDVVTVMVAANTWLALRHAGFWTGGAAFFDLGTAGLLMLAPLAAVAFARRFRAGGGEVRSAGRWRKRHHDLLAAMAVAGTAVSSGFGSNNGMLRSTSWAFVLLAAAMILLVRGRRTARGASFAPLVLCALLSTAAALVVDGGTKDPYRLAAPLDEQTAPIFVGARSSTLLVDSGTQRYLAGLRSQAVAAGWEPATPLIDLTGGSPGVTFFLGGRFPATAWLAGGYPGAETYVRLVLQLAGESAVRNAWVLTAPAGTRRIPERVLEPLGLDFPAAYELVGRARSAWRDESQELWRPVPTAAGAEPPDR